MKQQNNYPLLELIFKQPPHKLTGPHVKRATLFAKLVYNCSYTSFLKALLCRRIKPYNNFTSATGR